MYASTLQGKDVRQGSFLLVFTISPVLILLFPLRVNNRGLKSTLRDQLKSGVGEPATSRIMGDLSEDKSHNASKK